MKQFIITIGMAVLSVGCADQSIEPMENIENDIISRSMNSYSESTSNPTLGTDWEDLEEIINSSFASTQII
jgi:hypothetical protein